MHFKVRIFFYVGIIGNSPVDTQQEKYYTIIINDVYEFLTTYVQNENGREEINIEFHIKLK